MRTEGEVHRGAASVAAAPVGDECRRVVRRLHDGLGRMESALSARLARTVDALLMQENETLKSQCQRLARENEQLLVALRDTEARHVAVSQQVAALSTRLEQLIEQLGSALEE